MLLLGPVALAACSAGVAPASTPAPTTNGLAALQQYGYFTARLYAVMTFDLSGVASTWPTELAVPSVPVYWMNHIFDGKILEGGSGKDVTVSVHGSVSADGAWVENVSYSFAVQKSLYFRILLRTVPINKVGSPTGSQPNACEMTGPDVRKFVENVEYAAGGPVTLTAIDWANLTPGKETSLRLAFEKKPSRELSGTAGGGM